MNSWQPSLFEPEQPKTSIEELAYVGLRKLGERFQKIDPEKYQLSYSGGRTAIYYFGTSKRF